MAEDKKKYVYAGDPKDASSFKNYPAEPSAWDKVKESFEPTANRIMLDQVRKRRRSQAG